MDWDAAETTLCEQRERHRAGEDVLDEMTHLVATLEAAVQTDASAEASSEEVERLEVKAKLLRSQLAAGELPGSEALDPRLREVASELAGRPLLPGTRSRLTARLECLLREAREAGERVRALEAENAVLERRVRMLRKYGELLELLVAGEGTTIHGHCR